MEKENNWFLDSIKSFLAKQGLKPTDYCLCPMSEDEVHIRPLQVLGAVVIHNIREIGVKKGFAITIIKPDTRSDEIREIVFLAAGTDPEKLKANFPENFQESDGEFQQKYE